MKKIQTVMVLSIILCGLMISSTAGLAAVDAIEKNAIQTNHTLCESNPAKIKIDNGPVILSVSSDSSIVTGYEYDEKHPSVAASPNGGFYGTLEQTGDGFIWQPQLVQSADGTTWAPIGTYGYDDAKFTDMDANSGAAFGTFGAPPDGSGQAVVFNADSGDGWVWDWSDNGFTEFEYNSIACYEEPDTGETDLGWAIAFTGSYKGHDGVPLIMYREKSSSQYGIISWYENFEGESDFEDADCTIDPETNMLYAIHERSTGDKGRLMCRRMNVGVWYYSSSQGYYYHTENVSVNLKSSTGALAYASIDALHDNVIVVAQHTADTSDEIMCFTSFDGLDTRESAIIAEGSIPRVVFLGAETALCTYARDSSLYYITTEDGGLNWSEEQQVQDCIINIEQRSYDLTTKNGVPYVIWEDTRGDDVDIYFRKIGDFAQPPILEVTIQPGIGLGATAIIKNIGETDAENVTGTISVTGGLLGRINVSNEEDFGVLAVGDEVEIPSGFAIGFGGITISADATGLGDTVPGSDEKSGFQIIILTKVDE